jgi:hypothetical protein
VRRSLRWPVAIGAALLAWASISSCSSSESAERENAETRTRARQAVASLLFYPESAKFSDLVILESIEGHRVVCGKVSARYANSNEAGTQRFITNGAELTVLQEQANSESFDAAWLKICT